MKSSSSDFLYILYIGPRKCMLGNYRNFEVLILFILENNAKLRISCYVHG